MNELSACPSTIPVRAKTDSLRRRGREVQCAGIAARSNVKARRIVPEIAKIPAIFPARRELEVGCTVDPALHRSRNTIRIWQRRGRGSGGLFLPLAPARRRQLSKAMAKTGSPPRSGGITAARRDARAERLAAALKANLRRRKAQARERAVEPDTPVRGTEPAGAHDSAQVVADKRSG